MQTIDPEELSFARDASDDGFDKRVTRAQAPMQSRQFGLRLDHDTAPSTLVEPERDAARDRMSAADIDVSALARSTEGDVEMIVLHVLSISQRSSEGLDGWHHVPVTIGLAAQTPYFTTHCPALAALDDAKKSLCSEEIMN